MRRNEGQSVLVCCCEDTIRQNVGSSSSKDLRISSIHPISRFTARPHECCIRRLPPTVPPTSNN
jgi:hypothetical protein